MLLCPPFLVCLRFCRHVHAPMRLCISTLADLHRPPAVDGQANCNLAQVLDRNEGDTSSSTCVRSGVTAASSVFRSPIPWPWCARAHPPDHLSQCAHRRRARLAQEGDSERFSAGLAPCATVPTGATAASRGPRMRLGGAPPLPWTGEASQR